MAVKTAFPITRANGIVMAVVRSEGTAIQLSFEGHTHGFTLEEAVNLNDAIRAAIQVAKEAKYGIKPRKRGK